MFRILLLALLGLCLQILTQAAQNENFIHNCAQVTESGVFHLKTDFENKTHEFDVYCDNQSRDGGWTVVLRRNKGKLGTFARSNEEYINGFGSFDREFFIGLEKLYILTASRSHSLIFIMLDENNKSYVTYVPEFELYLKPEYEYRPIYYYEGDEIGMALSGAGFDHGWKFQSKFSPKTGNRLNVFGPYGKIGSVPTENTMGFYNEETKQVTPLRSLEILIRPVNIYRKSHHETFAFNLYEENEDLRVRTLLTQ